MVLRIERKRSVEEEIHSHRIHIPTKDYMSYRHTVHMTGIICVGGEALLKIIPNILDSPSQGEWSPVHSNACFISPLILIKRILSRLLGINIDWFWHYSCPRGPGLLFQGSCISFSSSPLLFGTWDESKTKFSGNVWDVSQVERNVISSKSE